LIGAKNNPCAFTFPLDKRLIDVQGLASMKTQSQIDSEKRQASAQYRREGKELFNLYSPTRLGWYVDARLKGKSTEQAIKIARPNLET
jgi:hypothetical protein